MLRRLHRWTSLPLILFLILILGTGVALQVEELGSLGGQEPAGRSGPREVASDAQIAGQLSDAIASARAAAPDFVPSRIELSIANGRQTTRLAQSPRGGPFVEVNHATGAVRAEMAPELPLHVVFIRLHTGAVMGPFGVIVMFIASLILLFLAMSGAIVYWQMWQNRRSKGRRDIFWK